MTTKYIEAKARYVQTGLSRFEVTDQYVYIDAGRLADDIDRVELRGDGEGNLTVKGGRRWVSAVRSGAGNGYADRIGDGDGDAIRSGSGGGWADRKGQGGGNAVRSGSGDGSAVRDGDGDGDAVRSGDGDGNAYHDGYGRGCARRTGKGKGKAREMRQLRAEFASPLRARRPT